MKLFISKICIPFIAIITFGSCSTTSKSTREAATKPEITLQIASLNLANIKRRIEKKDIMQLAKTLKQEQVEVLAVQNISRYPGVATRVDFVDELSAQSDMHNAFGEMLNNSGRQIGNAIFSSFPILSNHNQSFDNFRSANFEAALQATIDAGIRPLSVVSAQIPTKGLIDDQTQYIKLIIGMNPDPDKTSMVVAGNLPAIAKTTGSLEEIQSRDKESMPSQLWYTPTEGLKVLHSRIVETDLGAIIVVQMGFFR